MFVLPELSYEIDAENVNNNLVPSFFPYKYRYFNFLNFFFFYIEQ